MNLFYLPDPKGQEFILAPEESKHLVRVLRAVRGDEVWVTDGRGNMFRCTLSDPEVSRCTLNVVELHHRLPVTPAVHIGIAPPKNPDRLEWFLEKAVEIGVTSIVPFTSRYSERMKLKNDRLEKIMVSAMKQSQRAYLPELKPLCEYKEALSLNPRAIRLLAQAGGKAGIREKLKENTDRYILIGPEGDFSEEEVHQACDAGFTVVNLGERRLRTETAALVAVTAASLYCS